MPPKYQLKDLGLMDYAKVYALQKEELSRVIGGGPETIFLCEHPVVLTMGRLATESNILMAKDDLKKNGVEILRIDRGGEITLHCPGQLVIYPILNLNHFDRDLKRYMSKLEQVTIDLLQYFDIVANRLPGQRGVWVGPKKIASIGIGVRRWVSYHGLAINVNSDLSLFSMIRPCGLSVQMTSIQSCKNFPIDMGHVKDKIKEILSLNFNCQIV